MRDSIKTQGVVLVTGAGGFIGRSLCRVLAERGYTVYELIHTLGPKNRTTVKRQPLDLIDRIGVRKFIKLANPEFVVHLAATKDRSTEIGAFRKAFEVNVCGSQNIIEPCVALNLKRFVFLGSCDEYGQQAMPFRETQRESPRNAYGASKLTVTHQLQSLALSMDFPAVILRPAVVYGPGQGEEMFLSALIQSLIRKKEFNMTSGLQCRDFIYLDDVVEAILRTLIAKNLPLGQIINVSSAQPVQIRAVARMVATLIGQDRERLIRLGEKSVRSGEVADYWAANTLAKKLLDWQPKVALKDGLLRTIESFRRQVV
jgi:UDP-glucose 4-epimerase